MNFDQFFKFFFKNKNKIKNKKRFNKIILYYYEILLINRQKLKLGLINFEFADFQTFLLTGELLKMKFINQDTTTADSLKIENIIKRIEWQWNKTNVVSLIFTVFFILFLIKTFIKNWLLQSFPFLFYRWNTYDQIVEFSLNLIFKNSFSTFDFTWIDIILNFLIYFNLF